MAATMSMRQVPADPLAFIQKCVRERKILWTYHVNMRLERRHISRVDILDAVDTYELVEAYPEDKYLPSYLLIASNTFHVLFAADILGDNVRVVTAYQPNWTDWMPDLRTRRNR
ncbi:MAG TPA: DUF4258 domain-containing protein [Thermoanaerobaculia bacterium]|nr:DUF4258 domain-containing protein [Thermoanaerobaculia bacterium]